MKSKILLFLVLLCANLACYAQSVTLVETGIASTKDEATKQALRNALEQAYGTFVSSNTKIVNDQVTKDEIVSISQGNIEKYNEVSCQRVGNDYHVTVQATVSIGKLISYAKGKGASAEIAGATFGMNMKIKNLNKKNEEKALKHLTEELILFEKNNNFFDYSLDQSRLEPFEHDGHACVEFRIICKKNKNYYAYYDMLRNGLAAIGSRTKTEECTNLTIAKTGITENWRYNDEEWYFRNVIGRYNLSIINKLYFLGLFNIYKFKVFTGVRDIRCIGITDKRYAKSLREMKDFNYNDFGHHPQQLIEYSFYLPGYDEEHNVYFYSTARHGTYRYGSDANLVTYKSMGKHYNSEEPIALLFSTSYSAEQISKIQKIEVMPVNEIDIYDHSTGVWKKIGAM